MTLPPDLALALACAALSAALAAWPQALANPTKLGRLFQRVAFAASEASYSLYAYHFPLVLWISARHVGADQWTMNGAHVMAYLGFLAALLLGAAVFWWLFERQTDSLRRTAFKWLRV